MEPVAIVGIKDAHLISAYSANKVFLGCIQVTNGCIDQVYLSGGNIIVQYTEGGRRYINTYKNNLQFVSKMPL